MTITQKISRVLFLPSLILVAMLAMYVRTSQVMTAVEDGTLDALLSPAPAVAETKPEPSSPAAAAAQPTATSAPATEEVTEEILTEEDIKILQQLGDRRRELDRRATSIEQREALLQAAEQRVDQKIAELQKMREDLEKLLATANNEQSAQMASLVKIYSNMKPAQAAKIFEQLDMSVLLAVVQEMKEAKAAPILAAMDPQKAKTITTELIKRKDISKSAANQLNPQSNQ
jgi:flagellar motility protein MotE (MotC chaperone)